MVTRRAFLLGAGGALAATTAAGLPRRRAASSQLGQVPTAKYRLRAPTLSADGPPFEAYLSASSAYQGGAVRVRTNLGSEGTATVFGRRYPLQRGLNGLEGFIGFGTGDRVGLTNVEVQVTAPVAEHASLRLTVLKTDWTVDHIILPPPNPNDPDPPPPDLPDEQPRLNELYAGVSERRWRPTWIAPLNPPLVVSGYFGEQRSFNGGPVQGHHGGTDFGAIAGTPILATNDGTVVLAERVRVRGRLVVIDHGGGVLSSYGHQSALTVAEGEVVRQGQKIGEVGSTGLSTGAHLHWELAVGGVLVDGLRWLDGSQGF